MIIFFFVFWSCCCRAALYCRLLTQLQERVIDDAVVDITIDSAKELLRTSEFNTLAERTSLKNLGSWLGWVTLTRNRPILYKRLNLKVPSGLGSPLLPFFCVCRGFYLDERVLCLHSSFCIALMDSCPLPPPSLAHL